MAAPCFIAWNADTSALTGAFSGTASSATSGTVKTILQIKPGTPKIRIIEWGYSFDAVPTSPVRMELIETGTVFATVTTIGSGIRNYNDVTGASSQATTGTAATGFNASAEGSITASRLLAYNLESGLYLKQQFPLGREPEVNGANALRIRATPTVSSATTVSCYIIWEE